MHGKISMLLRSSIISCFFLFCKEIQKHEFDNEQSDCEDEPFPEIICNDNHPNNTDNWTCVDINYCFDHGLCHEMNKTGAENSAICAHSNDTFLCTGSSKCEEGKCHFLTILIMEFF